MAEPTEAVSNEFGTLQSRCDLLRSLHVPSRPLLLPNAWDAATARAVVTAGFPVVATTSEADFIVYRIGVIVPIR